MSPYLINVTNINVSFDCQRRQEMKTSDDANISKMNRPQFIFGKIYGGGINLVTYNFQDRS